MLMMVEDIRKQVKDYINTKNKIVWSMIISLLILLFTWIIIPFYPLASVVALLAFIYFLISLIRSTCFPLNTFTLEFGKVLSIESFSVIIDYFAELENQSTNTFLDSLGIFKRTIIRITEDCFSKDEKEKNVIQALKWLKWYLDWPMESINQSEIKRFAATLRDEVRRGVFDDEMLQGMLDSRTKERRWIITATGVYQTVWIVLIGAAIIYKTIELIMGEELPMMIKLYCTIVPDLAAIYFAVIAVKEQIGYKSSK